MEYLTNPQEVPTGKMRVEITGNLDPVISLPFGLKIDFGLTSRGVGVTVSRGTTTLLNNTVSYVEAAQLANDLVQAILKGAVIE